MTGHRILLAFRAIFYATCFVLLSTWLALIVQPLDERLPLDVPRSLRPVGLAIGLPAALLAVWCVFTFITKGRGTPAPFDPPRDFVATGPYRYVRNPMYIGGLGVLFAAGIVLASPSIVLLTGLFGLSAHLFVVLYEEPSLEARFRESYVRYKRTVHRWVPRPPSDDPP